MSIIMNEKEYAQGLLEKRCLGSKPFETLGYIARYYRDADYSSAETKGLLENFMLQCDPDINLVKWQDTIDAQVKRAAKRKPIVVEKIYISGKELETCRELSSRRLQRLLFTLMCLAKFSNEVSPSNNNWVNRTDKEIFSAANIAIPVRQQSLMLNDLKTLGLIRFSKKVDNLNINVTCLDPEGGTELVVEDMRNLGNQYMKYCGEPYIECVSCGLVVKKTGRSQKYCNDCAVTINSQKTYSNYIRSLPS